MLQTRRANTKDIPAISALERQTRTAAHWSQEQYERAFTTDETHPASSRVAWVIDAHLHTPPQILAFLIAYSVPPEWEVENIVVAQILRRQGVGTLLLNELIAYADAQQGSKIFLEVRESNQTARRLYKKLGFAETGSRPGYYSDPVEDAVLYQLSLPQSPLL